MRAGDRVGGFEIERLVRTGGMGLVYRARDHVSGQIVALKMLHDPVDGDDRFQREARILADLRHPAIVRYVAHGTTPEGEPYLAMEWLEGEDLGQRLRRQGFTIDESVRLLRRITGGLAPAHERGVIHRDIKPGNIFLPGGEVDQAKLLDFGVARLARASASGRLTQTGMLVGTPAYMAPEQVRGARDIDARADVFSLGCLLFECLTGRPAFVAEHWLAVLAKLLFEAAPRTVEVRADVPPELDALVARMLAKDAAERLPDGAAVLEALVALGMLSGEAAPAAAARPPALSAAERRVVSVVFAKSGLGEADESFTRVLGVEESKRLEDELRAVARRFGAQLERVTSGTLAAALVEGGPATDQAADAARCALALKTLMPAAPMALATGRGVLGGILPVGDAIDRAARLLAGRTRGGIWLDSMTSALLEGRFDIETSDDGIELLGARDREEPVRTLLGRPTPCVGRERELMLLDAAYAECVSEPVARAVLVTAPTGVGKSRLRYEWLLRLAQRRDPARVLICRGDPMSAGSPFVLVSQAVRQAAGLLGGEPAEEQRARLHAHLEQLLPAGDVARVAAFLGELLGVSGGEASPELRAARGTPILMGDQMRLAWEDWLAGLARRQPVILVLDDLHWGDAPSVKFIDAALRNLREQPIFILALARRDVHELFPSLWQERGVQEIRLADLSRKAAERLARAVLGDRAPDAKLAWICDRAGGNALYLEELIRAVAEGLESGVPESVVAMVQARLLGLSAESRRVLRAASVFGEVFWAGGVAALAGGADPHALEDLCEREVLTRQRSSRFPGETEYVFRHALFRDASYDMLTDSDRALGHRLAAAWLLEVGERQPLVLAEHLERGGDAAGAIAWYERAVEEALEGNDFLGGIERAARAIACGPSQECLGRLRLRQAEAHNWRGEHKDGEWCALAAMHLLPVGAALWLAAAKELLGSRMPARRDHLDAVIAALASPPLDDEETRKSYVMAGVAAVNHLYYYGDRAEALPLLARVEETAAGLGGAVAGWVVRARASAHDFDGAHDQSRLAYRTAADCFEAVGDLRNGCSVRANVGWLEATELGMPEQAEVDLRHGLEAAARMGLTRTVAVCQQNLGVALMWQGRLGEARALLEASVADFVRQRDPRMEGGSHYYLAILGGLDGDLARAEEEARAAIALAQDVPTTRACALAALTRVLVAGGRAEEALESARAAQAILVELGGIEEGEGLIRLVHAEALAAAGLGDEAKAAIAEARARLMARAAKIEDPAVKDRFLGAPDHARCLALAKEWLG